MCCVFVVLFFFFKQKTAYEMRISDWSSDVCSSDLMLTGTLITAAGFLPIATAASSTGEYTRSLFQVVTIALLVSWVAAVVFIPYLGDKLLPDHGHSAKLKPGSLAARWHAQRQQIGRASCRERVSQ